MTPSDLSPVAGSPAELARFAELQAGLADRFRRFAEDPRQPYTAVVIPSQSFDPAELAKIDGIAHYEERSLFNLMLLRHPRLKVVFVTSKRLNPLIIDYYLHQMRGVPGEHARARLCLLDCDDASPRPLSAKILERPRLLQRLRQAIDDPAMAHMVVFNSSPLERTLAVQLGIPINGCDPALSQLGHKTGSRQVFKEAGLEVAPGREGLRDTRDLRAALAELWEAAPSARRMVVKLNDSFSGEGNAILDVGPLGAVAPGTAGVSAAEREAALGEALPGLRFEAKGLTWEAYSAQFDGMGGVCEVWVEGEGKTSPSVQVRINPLREVQVVSTHDQVLGGPSGQIFLGASFPADPTYRLALQAEAVRVGEVLAARGVIGRFGVDFLVVPELDHGRQRIYAVEINLRAGGTTHPFNTLKFLTDGRYDRATGEFMTPQGQARCYFATDNLRAPHYRGILPIDLLDQMVIDGLHFRSDETGVVFHLLGALSGVRQARLHGDRRDRRRGPRPLPRGGRAPRSHAGR
ncbi:MAG: hypothetical protein KC420_03905, partial [Myxococcales bacterium]|nr:hypothetical protein [Myxococcales bacterium]